MVSGMIWVGILPLPAQLTSINLWAGLAQGFQGVSIPPLRMEFQLDALSAFFVFLVTAFSAVVSVYSFGALNASHYERYRSRIIAAFNLFIWSTVMVIVSHDVFSLLLSLEISSLVLAYLALYKHMFYQSQPNNFVSQEAQKKARIAPQVYLALSHTSIVLLVIALITLSILAHSTSFERLIFSGQHNFLLSYHLPIASFVFLLTLAGAGIRAGLTPAHIWPPLVHPGRAHHIAHPIHWRWHQGGNLSDVSLLLSIFRAAGCLGIFAAWAGRIDGTGQCLVCHLQP